MWNSEQTIDTKIPTKTGLYCKIDQDASKASDPYPSGYSIQYTSNVSQAITTRIQNRTDHEDPSVSI